jgi:hypothetical protein
MTTIATPVNGTITQRDVQEAPRECLPVVDNEIQQRAPIVVDGQDLWALPHEEVEAVVDRYLPGALKTSMALYVLHERHEYGDRTFEQFCQERFGFSAKRGYQLMDAAEVVSTMVDLGLPPPENERIARALAPIKDDHEALAQVSKELEGQVITGESTKAAVKRVKQKKAPPTPPEQAPEAPKESKENKRIDTMFFTAMKLCDELEVHFPEPNKGEFVREHLSEVHGFSRDKVERAIDYFMTLRQIGDDLNWFAPVDGVISTAPVDGVISTAPVIVSAVVPPAKPKAKRKGTSRAARLDDAMDLLGGSDFEKARDAAAAYLDALDGRSEWQGDPPAFGYSSETLQEVLGVVEDLYEQTENQVSGMEGTPLENTSKYEDLQGSLEGLEALKDALENLEGLEIPEAPCDPKDRDAWETYTEALNRLHDAIEDALSAGGDVCFP